MTIMMRVAVQAVALGVVVAATAGCSQGTGPGPGPTPPGGTAPSAAATSASPPRTPTDGTVPEGQRALVARFVGAVNAGDEAGVRDTFAPEARFDSVGRIYQGREEIMDRFLVPEVIRAGGRYTLLALTPGQDGRVVAEYDYDTGGGGREHFTYDCEVRADRFADCVGRYV
ncbi:nuclear transport factor 2 family protein [Nonomuraea sp. NPDC049709]|uniref:nuclear transport factor 2 family protein n=1 Tax=Nonomuraea sp. NPDC049709 TaxID=3154736 RepID=UPI003447BFEA